MSPSRHLSDKIIQRLRASTADVHKRIEAHIDVFNPTFDLPSYTRLLERFYGYWAPLEASLRAVAGLDDPRLQVNSRFKAHLLEDDLKTLGIDPERVPRCADLPRIDSLASALGCMYVLEGSTLGAQFIARHLRSRFQLTYGSGASFFNAYGDQVPARWADFRSFLGVHADEVRRDELADAARQTFEAFERWLTCAE